jgi:hypothetical protein
MKSIPAIAENEHPVPRLPLSILGLSSQFADRGNLRRSIDASENLASCQAGVTDAKTGLLSIA